MREENKYVNMEDNEEVRRLRSQRIMMHKFDNDVYHSVTDKYQAPRVLDVGSNRGDLAIEVFPNARKIVGLEYNEDAVNLANDLYCDEQNIKFFQIDLESPELYAKLKGICKEMHVDKFDIIHLSMVLLHLKNVELLMTTLKDFLAEGGTVLIKDVDDGISIAYPDPEGWYAKAIELASYTQCSGFRHSGRQILELLVNTGYHNIQLEPFLISTVGMSEFERKLLFDTFFVFVREDIVAVADRNPDDKEANERRSWLCDHYDALEEGFMYEGFFFTIGIMMFTATA